MSPWSLCLLSSIIAAVATAKLRQIGAIPLKGNAWRPKQAEEIKANLSEAFVAFSSRCMHSQSSDTSLPYFVADHNLRFHAFEEEEWLCEQPLGNLNPYRPDLQALTVYFACDDTCCSLECCQRDWSLSIAGYFFISAAPLIAIIYAFLYSFRILVSLRNLPIFDRKNGPECRGRGRGEKQTEASTSLMLT